MYMYYLHFLASLTRIILGIRKWGTLSGVLLGRMKTFSSLSENANWDDMGHYGHVTGSTGLAKMILQGTVQGGRRKGRQKKRWEDNKYIRMDRVRVAWSPSKGIGQRGTEKHGCPTILDERSLRLRYMWVCEWETIFTGQTKITTTTKTIHHLDGILMACLRASFDNSCYRTVPNTRQL